jgi:hypothetical protein
VTRRGVEVYCSVIERDSDVSTMSIEPRDAATDAVDCDDVHVLSRRWPDVDTKTSSTLDFVDFNSFQSTLLST